MRLGPVGRRESLVGQQGGLGLVHRQRSGRSGPAGVLGLETATRKVRTLARFRGAKLNRAGAGLPEPIPVPIASRHPIGAFLARGGTGEAADLQPHQRLAGPALWSKLTLR